VPAHLVGPPAKYWFKVSAHWEPLPAGWDGLPQNGEGGLGRSLCWRQESELEAVVGGRLSVSLQDLRGAKGPEA